MFQSIYHLLFGKRFEFDTPLDIIETTIRLDHHAIRDASRSRFARSQPNHITVQAKDERTYRFRSQSNKTHLLVSGELRHYLGGTTVVGRARYDLYMRCFSPDLG